MGIRVARAVAAAAVAVAALGLVAAAANSGRTPTVTAITTPTTPPTPTATSTRTPPAPRTAAPTPSRGSGWVVPGTVLVLLAAAGLSYLFGFWTWMLRRSRGGAFGRWQLPWVRRVAPPENEPEPVVTGALASAVDAGLRGIAEGEPRDAVVACWVLLERAAADAGTARRPAETPAELTARVLGAHRVTPEPLRRLADLYREARYSRHRLGEPEREQARAALERVRGELAEPTPVPP